MKFFDSKKALALLLSLTLTCPFIPNVFAVGEFSEPDATNTVGEQEEQATETFSSADSSSLIERAYLLTNGVNAYYTDGERSGFVTENQNMKLTYSTDMMSERKVTSLTDKNGNAYLTDTMDVFVKMKDGGTYYASKTANSAKVSQFAGLNIFRFGYYYYDVRIEDQSFVNEIKVIDEKTLNIKKLEATLGVDTKSTSDGLFCRLNGSSVDPQVVFSNISFD